LGTSTKWRKIVEVNPQLFGRKTAIDGSPLIFPGDILIIPDEETPPTAVIIPEPVYEEPVYAPPIIPPAPPPPIKRVIQNAPPKKTVVLSDGNDDVSIIIEGKRFIGFTSYNLKLSYDSLDAFSFSAPYDPAIKDLKESLTPFAFKSCEVYYANTLIFRGVLLTPDPELADKSSEITLQGYPLCGVLNDCMLPPTKYPLGCNGINMKGIAEAACAVYQIPVFFDGDIGSDFTEVSIEPTDKILDFLLKLAKQRGLLFTNNEEGSLVFFNSRNEKAFVSFKEGKQPLLSIKPKFNAQEFYSHITGFSKTDAEYPSLSYTYENKYLIQKGVLRHHSVMIDDADTSSDLEAAVKAYAGRMFADCVSFDLQCEGHLNERNELFQKGMTVCVYAPSAMIARDTNFIAREITITRTTQGRTASMNLVLPGSYTGETMEVFPWE
jgi:prophage tail gpP-like protein